jgi:hypothetical protein
MVAFAGAKLTGFVSGDEQAHARATRTRATVAARRVMFMSDYCGNMARRTPGVPVKDW